MNKVVHFEIPADDISRAKKFYSDVFGWQTMDFGPETSMVTTVETDPNTQMPKTPGAINGDISKRSEKLKHPSIVMSVDSIDEYLKKIESSGGKTVMAKTPIADMGFHAMFEDSEGNTLGLWEDRK